jgi:hypothetical protein
MQNEFKQNPACGEQLKRGHAPGSPAMHSRPADKKPHRRATGCKFAAAILGDEARGDCFATGD